MAKPAASALTEKQEAFAVEVAKGTSLTKAYKLCLDAEKMSDTTVLSRAKELARTPHVEARISVLRSLATAAAVRATAYTLEAAMKEADIAYEAAHALGQTSTMVSAATLKAKLAGHLIERKEVRSGPLEDADISELTRLRSELKAARERESHADDLVGSSPTPAVRATEGNRPTSRALH